MTNLNEPIVHIPHECPNCKDLKAENERLRKAIEEALEQTVYTNKAYWLSVDGRMKLKKALEGETNVCE